MKKHLMRFTFAVIVALLFSSIASAADFNRQAGYLNRLEILRGSTGGYQLSRAPTRLEAAVMIVRLLSSEKQALSGSCPHPFIDVPSWADGYVGYLYQKGIIKGADSQFFNSYQDLSADMYLTFLLRALGYSDTNGDFDGSSVRKFAASVGLLDGSLLIEITNKQFLRGDMAALSFEALSCPVFSGDSEKTLFDVWEEAHGQTDTSAEIAKLFETCKKLEAALLKTANLTESEVDSSYLLKLMPGGEYSQKATVKRQIVRGLPEASSEIEYDEVGKTGWSKLYYKNGTAYLSDSENQKVKFQTEIESVFPADEELGKLSFGAGQIISYTETTEGKDSIITLVVDGSLYDGKWNMQTGGEAAGGDKIYGELTFIYNINQKGCLNAQTLFFDFLYVSGDKKCYGVYEESTLVKEEDRTPIKFPSFSGYTNANHF